MKALPRLFFLHTFQYQSITYYPLDIRRLHLVRPNSPLPNSFTSTLIFHAKTLFSHLSVPFRDYPTKGQRSSRHQGRSESAKQIIFKAGYENNLLFYVQKEKMCIFVAQKYTSKVWQRNRRIRPPSVLKRQYGITSELSGLFAESHRLEEEIRKQLKTIGFEVKRP